MKLSVMRICPYPQSVPTALRLRDFIYLINQFQRCNDLDAADGNSYSNER